jgi:signal transduction histidine kinase
MSFADDVLPALGALVLTRVSHDRFVPRGALPEWCQRLGRGVIEPDTPFAVSDVFPFFELFLLDAEAVWGAQQDARLESDGFSQVVSDGEELHLAAVALMARGEALLVVLENERAFVEERLMLQRARELRFAHDALSHEIEQKEVLAHCVVHDLRSPLNSVLGALALLQRTPHEPHDAKLIQLALNAAEHQDALIREILEVFSEEKKGTAAETGGEPSADVPAVIGQVAAMLEPRARVRDIDLDVEFDDGDGLPLSVAADELRLFRVIGNLAENALRYSPSGSMIRVAVGAREDGLLIVVEDEGPGVSASLVPNLFKKFARANDGSPGTGLGLYFCRISVERWGGTIGYEARAEGGSRFWIRLPRVTRSGDRERRAPSAPRVMATAPASDVASDRRPAQSPPAAFGIPHAVSRRRGPRGPSAA